MILADFIHSAFRSDPTNIILLLLNQNSNEKDLEAFENQIKEQYWDKILLYMMDYKDLFQFLNKYHNLNSNQNFSIFLPHLQKFLYVSQ